MHCFARNCAITVWSMALQMAGSIVAGDFVPDFDGNGGPATSARLYYPKDVAADSAGNLHIADYLNLRIRRVQFAPK